QIAVLINTNSLQAGGKRVGVTNGGIIINADWRQTSYDSDIALIRLAENINSTPIPGPILAAQEHDGDNAVVTGWGGIDSKQNPLRTNILQEAKIQIIPRDMCNKRGSYDNKINTHMLCLGDFSNGQKDFCTGDSGGPATVTIDSRTRLLGIVSWSDPLC